MTTEKVKFTFDKSMLMLALILFLFAAIVAGLLGFVNYVTEAPIRQHQAQKTAEAMQKALYAERYDKLEYTGADETVAAVYRAGDAGWVVEVTPSGFGGVIHMVVGVDAAGAVAGVSIVKMSETSGLGANAGKASFREQFTGGTGSVALTKQGGEIDALTGATVTSAAVVRGVNSALNAAAVLRGGADTYTGATAPAAEGADTAPDAAA